MNAKLTKKEKFAMVVAVINGMEELENKYADFRDKKRSYRSYIAS
jgi:hypothetical protein